MNTAHQLSFDDVRPQVGVFSDLKPEIVDKFLDFHRQNPRVYELFRRFSRELKARGLRHYGAKAIMERIRWEIEVETSGEFKVNNNWASCYPRLLLLDYPEFRDFFEIRHTPGTVGVR